MKHKIVAACSAGLGNRIKCMTSVLKKCNESNNNTPYVYWSVNDECGCEFSELFESSTPLKEIGKGELDTIKVDAWNNNAEINKSWKLDANDDIDFKYHKLSQAQINKFLPYILNIKPKEDIQDAVWAFCNKYKESFDKSEVIGVHIRKGDHKVSFDGRGRISQDDYFMERIRCLLEVNPNYKFLLCTEDEETEEKFLHRFSKEHIIYFPKRFRSRNTPESIKEAFVDILLLAQCPIIIGTFLSTFTEIAWWLGGCKAQVVIPGAGDKEAVDKVLSKLPQKGEGIHKKIWRKLMIWWKEKS